ncbi:Nif3-like dinuclear metal center hexameric protein [Bombiscardovia coagulans]|uniref:GTP cyclohydrolase 1 type 2 homolog n=1 Tax=Bombiscardovia coagulans TaxID=686666 RepID=A0A261ET06_9BIFI|nr:Nif3-like dinuclear metal center hexameric protein [Bombiscardovia coagulans]OZG50002.1 PadR family transcriptional regulator [Bombiscardovia coagulans]
MAQLLGTELSLAEVVKVLECLYPLSYAEDWDYPGLVVGDPDWSVNRIYCAVDPTLEIVEEAIESGAQLLVCHHPLFFRSVHEISGKGVHGAIVNRLIQAQCGLWVGHTNADAAMRGVAQAAADAMGLVDQHPLQIVQKDTDDWHVLHGLDGEVGLGRVGRLRRPMSLRDCAGLVASLLPPTQVGVQVAGDPDASVQTVAVLPGSGDSMFDAVRASGVDVYVTSDLRHHPVTDVREQAQYEAQLRFQSGGDTQARPMLINTPHSAIESLWFTYAKYDIPEAVKKATGQTIEIEVTKHSSDPWTFVLR